jgi:hypothetical protein
VIGSLLVGLLAVAPAAGAEHRYALVVGNDRGDADEQRLQYATRDATRVGEVLQSLGGVSPADVVLLHNPDAGQVRQVLDTLTRRIAAEQQADDRSLLFLYYSGHADADTLHLSGTRLPLAELKAAAESAPADVRLLVIDACRAGSITRLKGGAPVAPFEINLGDAGSASSGLAIITAAAPGEDAQESERLQGGVFTHHFLAGLQGAADASGDHVVTLDEVYRYSKARTILTTSQAPVVQHPNYRYQISGGEQLALTRLDGARRMGQLRLDLGGEYIVFDARESQVVAEFEVDSGGVIALPEGRYVVRRRTPARVYQADVRVEEGQLAQVSEDLLRQLPYGQTARRGGATERHVALGIISGAAVTGPLEDGMSASPGGFAGIRLDSPALTVDVRLRYSVASGDNDYLSISQSAFAIDTTATRLWDVGRVAGGAGLRIGGERFTQRFETEGTAPDRTAAALHASPIVRGELSLTPRLSLGVEAGLSAYVLPADDTYSLTAVPYASADLSVFAF